ncbi:sialidase family protein [Brucellaceae bacterium C25G]
MTPDSIAAAMNGRLHKLSPEREEAFLPSPMVQNHAAFLHMLKDGTLICAWFGGTLEGKSDISIFASLLLPSASRWSKEQRLSFDETRSEQNPVLFSAPDGRLLLFHTSQPSGNQDECRIRMAEIVTSFDDPAALQIASETYLNLPQGCFIRAPLTLRKDGAWILPIFRCVQREGQRWNGSHDHAAIGISFDAGETWTLEQISNSTGCVHMSPVQTGDNEYAAFFRRRQSDYVYRSESLDGGHHWSEPTPTNIPNNNSSIAVITLKNGHQAMICNPINADMNMDRRLSLYDELDETDARPDADHAGGCTPIWGVVRAPVAVMLSDNKGQTFSRQIIIEDGPGTCTSNNSTDGFNKEMSYPWLLEGHDGSLHIAYTYHRRAIKYVRLAAGWADRTEEVK